MGFEVIKTKLLELRLTSILEISVEMSDKAALKGKVGSIPKIFAYRFAYTFT